MIIKAKITFRHRGQTFISGIQYDVAKGDGDYFIAAKWATAAQGTAQLSVAELGVDPETKWVGSGEKIMAGKGEKSL